MGGSEAVVCREMNGFQVHNEENQKVKEKQKKSETHTHANLKKKKTFLNLFLKRESLISELLKGINV